MYMDIRDNKTSGHKQVSTKGNLADQVRMEDIFKDG